MTEAYFLKSSFMDICLEKNLGGRQQFPRQFPRCGGGSVSFGKYHYFLMDLLQFSFILLKSLLDSLQVAAKEALDF